MDIVIVIFVNILASFLAVITYIFAVLLFAFMLGGFLIAILGYFRVKRLENPEILQNKIKSHRRVLNIFTGIFLTIIAGVVVIFNDGWRFCYDCRVARWSYRHAFCICDNL